MSVDREVIEIIGQVKVDFLFSTKQDANTSDVSLPTALDAHWDRYHRTPCISTPSITLQAHPTELMQPASPSPFVLSISLIAAWPVFSIRHLPTVLVP
jgi:hypothetical protein